MKCTLITDSPNENWINKKYLYNNMTAFVFISLLIFYWDSIDFFAPQWWHCVETHLNTTQWKNNAQWSWNYSSLNAHSRNSSLCFSLCLSTCLSLSLLYFNVSTVYVHYEIKIKFHLCHFYPGDAIRYSCLEKNHLNVRKILFYDNFT